MPKDPSNKPKEANALFEDVSDFIDTGFFGRADAFEAIMTNVGMSRTAGSKPTDKIPGAWSQWELASATGTLVVKGLFPALLSKEPRNDFQAFYFPAAETPIPAAMLTYLLSQTREMKIVSGDVIEVSFASESNPFSDCSLARSMRLRLITGAMVSNSIRGYCRIRKQ